MSEEQQDQAEVKEDKAPEVKEQAPKPKDAKEGELGNEHLFLAGEEVELKGLKFVCKEVRGVDLVLARKDFK